MESSHQASKIMGRLLLVVMFLLLGYAALNQYSSSIVQKLAAHQDSAVKIAILTEPGMIVSYNPATSKAHITVNPDETKGCNSKQTRCPFKDQPGRFFKPETTGREDFWEEFKQGLSSWRYSPVLVGNVFWSYLTAWHEKRTNLSPAEFTLLALEIIKLEPSDFTVKLPPAPTKKRGARKEPAFTNTVTIPAKAPLAVGDRPLILEIFNASGKKGIAQELTQYLRAQNEKGLLRVDVFQYENYPSIQEVSWLEDYSGRLADVKQLSHALGINSEIHTGTTPNVMCDTRIIIGRDFTMPL